MSQFLEDLLSLTLLLDFVLSKIYLLLFFRDLLTTVRNMRSTNSLSTQHESYEFFALLLISLVFV